MASRSRKPTSLATRGLRRAAATDVSFLPALEQFLAGEGQISVGTIGPIGCAAVANDQHKMLAPWYADSTSRSHICSSVSIVPFSSRSSTRSLPTRSTHRAKPLGDTAKR